MVADAKAPDLFAGARPGGLGLLRDLHDLWLMANNAHLSITILAQTARDALREDDMAATLIEIGLETERSAVGAGQNFLFALRCVASG